MNKKFPASLLSLSVLLSSVAQTAPLLAATVQTPVRIVPVVPALRTGAVVPNLNLPATPGSIPNLTTQTGIPGNPIPALNTAPAGQIPQASAPGVSASDGRALISPLPEQPKAPRRSLLGRLTSAVAAKLSWGKVFDSSRVSAPAGVMGILPLPTPTLPQGVVLDPAPSIPDSKKVPSVTINAFDIPGAKTPGGVFDAGPKVLQADPNSEADMERALREVVEQDAARYGVSSKDLSTVHVRLVKGEGDQADTIYAYFRQMKEGKNQDGSSYHVPVHGAYLSFTVKVLKGAPVLMASMAKLFPTISVNTTPSLSDDQLKAKAEARLGIPPNSGLELVLVERKIIFSQGSWHAANLYVIEGLPFMIAVDVATGEAFAWDARMGVLQDEAAGAPVSGKAAAMAEKDDHRPNGTPVLTELALPHLNVSISGKQGRTDVDGKFSGSSSGGKAEFTATLSGQWAQVNDMNRKPLKISATLKPGQENTVVFNAADSDELTIDQVNTYIAVTRIHDWWSERLSADKRIDQQVPANVNIDDECNAYYTPGRPSLNFFKSSANCSDTGRPGVVAHEYGHFVDDMIGGIVNGGMSEGWGDIGSMFLLGTPIIGEGFLKNRNPSYIRHGDNTYQYSDNDEVHDQGQAWMGFGWKLRKSLIASLGEAAGAAMAESLIIPTLFSKAADIPSQMAQVLLKDMDKDGNLPHEAAIRAAAKAHGIDLPKNPGLIASLWNGLFGRLRRLRSGGLVVESSVPAAPAGALPQAALAASALPSETPTVVRAKLTFTAGALIRGQVRNQIRRFLDEQDDLTYDLKEYKRWLDSDFLLTIQGPKESVERAVDAINSWFAEISSRSNFRAPAPSAPPTGRLSFAAPASKGGFPDAEIRQHIDEAGRMSSSWANNQSLETYFQANEDRLAPRQVQMLLAALVRNDSNSYGRADTYYRMADAYFGRPGRMTPSEAREIAGGSSYAWQTNYLTEKYFNGTKGSLSPDDVKLLQAGLIRNDSNSYGRADTYYRMADSYFGFADMTPSEAREIAGGSAYAWQTNYLIEKYYQRAKHELSWENVKYLLDGLVRNDSNSHGRADTEDRILRDWEKIAHRA